MDNNEKDSIELNEEEIQNASGGGRIQRDPHEREYTCPHCGLKHNYTNRPVICVRCNKRID